MLYYIFILHQTTTAELAVVRQTCCIISSFYIKPQLKKVVSDLQGGCIISSFYIKPQRPAAWLMQVYSCIISSFYIKPQLKWLFPVEREEMYYIFILHQTTTCGGCALCRFPLYYIFILHQTTTTDWATYSQGLLYYIFILHQTTTSCLILNFINCCIISSFYIKPQPLS